METKSVHPITIAIPAYNEASNLPHIISDILAQRGANYKIHKIVVYSDGSEDSTVSVIQKYHAKYPFISIVDGKTRRGKFFRLNQAFQSVEDDILVVLDADVGLVGNYFLSNLVSALTSDPKAVMVAAHQEPLRADTFSGRVLYASFKLWDYIRLEIPRYDHVHNFYGAATAYQACFAKSIDLPSCVTNERNYIYECAKAVNGFRYCLSAKIVYWPPTTFSDYIKLSRRSFGKGGVEILPVKYKIRGLLKALKSDPFYTPLALVLSYLFGKIVPLIPSSKKPFWEIVKSSKKTIPVSASSNSRVIISTYDDLKNPYYAGGGAVAISEIADRMSSEFDITVLTGSYPNSTDEYRGHVYYKHVGPAWVGPKLGQLLFPFSLLYYARTLAYDLWIESFTPPFSVSLLPIVAKKPVIGLAHMLSGEDMQRKYKLPFPVIERWGLRNYRHIISPSPFYSRQISLLNPCGDVVAIPNGVTPFSISSKKNTHRNNISFLGRIEINQKGMDLLLTAFKKFAKTSSYNLQIAGSGEASEIAKLNKLIDDLHLGSRVKVLGRINNQQKAEFFQSSIALVIPSRFETFSISALEGLSAGVPFICFDIPGLGWLPENSGIKVPLPNTDSLSNAMEKISNDPRLWQVFSSHAQQFAKKYSWESSSKRYSQYLNQVLNYG